jgi:hypothetical protein
MIGLIIIEFLIEQNKMSTMTELETMYQTLKAEREKIDEELMKITKEFEKKISLVDEKIDSICHQMTELECQEDEKRRIEEFDGRDARSIKHKELERIPLSIAKEVVEIYKEGKIIWSLDELQETTLLTGLELRDKIIHFLSCTYAKSGCSYCDSIFHEIDDCTVKCKACAQSGHSIKECPVPISQFSKHHIYFH